VVSSFLLCVRLHGRIPYFLADTKVMRGTNNNWREMGKDSNSRGAY